MDTRLSKLHPRTVVSCVVILIFISGLRCEDRTSCYWCGPLAEQVHRSQRAPSCSQFHLEHHQTLCDEGFTHCAIVAVSPPYTESRLCVKFYQDECYSLYCNSTKTWRMVCACRGDLCNGPLTARETEAFALLPKFTKTKPHKRNFMSHFISVKTRKPTDDNTVIIISKENETIYSIQNDQPQPNENGSDLLTPTPKRAEDEIIIVHGMKNIDKNFSINYASLGKAEIHYKGMGSEDAMPGHDRDLGNAKTYKEVNNAEVGKSVDNPEMDKLDNADLGMNVNNSTVDKHIDNAEVSKNVSNSKVDKHIDNAEIGKSFNNSEIGKHVGNSQVGKHLDNAEEDKKESETKNFANAEMDKPVVPTGETIIKPSDDSALTATTSMNLTGEIAVAVAVQSSAAPKKMPPAEALQQNATPTKSTDLTTLAMSTENHIIETTLTTALKTPNKKNSGTQNLAHLIIFVIYFPVHYCI